MNKSYMYPMKLAPVLKDIMWGGSRLCAEYRKGNKDGGKNKKIAESWELTIHKNGTNIIENGEFKNHSLEEVFKISEGEIVSGGYKNTQNSGKFPVLIKFIDAEQDLSVQVHPDNSYAESVENELGKTEMWYIIDALPGAKIVYGLNGDYTREELEKYISEDNFEKCLAFKDVKAGEVYFIPAGLVHAIGKGIFIAEIQQNSDTTYRFYDYGRTDANGNKRELHIEKALDVCIKTKAICSDSENKKNTVIESNENCIIELLTVCDYFTVKKFEITGIGSIELTADISSFNSLVCIDGTADIIVDDDIYQMQKGDSYFIPANLGRYRLKGNCVFLYTTYFSF